MTRFVLRAARPTDAGAVGAILSEFVDQTAWMPRLHSRAEEVRFAGQMIERGWVDVAEPASPDTTTGPVAGFAARDGTQVHALYVASVARGRGCGRSLLKAMQAAAPALHLWTFAANVRARAFYTRHGFVETGRTDGQSTDEGLPDVRFMWSRGEI